MAVYRWFNHVFQLQTTLLHPRILILKTLVLNFSIYFFFGLVIHRKNVHMYNTHVKHVFHTCVFICEKSTDV